MSTVTPIDRRQQMVETQIAARGIADGAVLEAMRAVPREAFVSETLEEFAYADTPLAIESGQTISQPYIVALMAEAMAIAPGDRVLEVGAGSGYASAVLSRIAGEVYAIERHDALADLARRRMRQLGCDNVHVRQGDGTEGWPEEAPFDAIAVAAGGPSVPAALKAQLAIGGRLVIPVGGTPREQELLRVTRVDETRYSEESLGAVRSVPLIGVQGWADPEAPSAPSGRPVRDALPRLLREAAEPIDDVETVDLDPLLDRIGDARVVLLGEATHGTSEFYRMRARITRELILNRGFRAVAVEADWPDAASIDRYVRHRPTAARREAAFTRFPTWMWRNREVHDFVEWLRQHNERDPAEHVGFHGLDLYSLYASAAAVVEYLDRIDPKAAAVARQRYGCLTPWERDPAAYGRAALTGEYRTCEGDVVAALRDLLAKRLDYGRHDGDRFFDAERNARLVADAERYYRVMYYGAAASWNLRDQHMFDTLASLLAFHGADARIVVWEHNSHIGDSAATEMAARGEHNVGHLCRTAFGAAAYLIGFGTDRGTVAAASDWDGPMEIKDVRPAHRESYERLCHDSTVPAFLLPLRAPARDAVREALSAPRLERAIGVIYRPETELASHYFQAALPDQFDEYVWFDETHAVAALSLVPAAGMPETYPFGV